MATQQEKLDLARRIAGHEVAPDMCTEWNAWTEDERRETMAYVLYIIRTRPEPGQAKAIRLFRSWLSPEQRFEFRRRRYVIVTGSAGGRYRIEPGWSRVSLKLERHGSREYGVAYYCLHDEAGELPHADLALAHMLMIVSDEPGFLAQANEHKVRLSLWDGAWRRRLNVARRLRQQGVPEDQIVEQIDAALGEREVA